MTGNNIPTTSQDKQHRVPQKATDLPLQPNNFTAKTYNPNTGSFFQAVFKAVEKNRSAKRCTGIGFIFTEADGYAGIDIDYCLNNDQLKQVARLYTACLVSSQLGLEKTVTHNGLRKYLTKPTTSKRRNNEE